ncbi:hypothetical protein [Cochleicola gelatinilyticus]|uniref:Uncharacterized protein n=1 Tax=Cochleicola gelatinilyticus TaxID=1763537 RepID=A0A167GXU9_9FLAO|nr:hypothetical protein [Cochleicola gelatinilyticus]OAB78019.1 hypothetical protein ULVI_11070 [Cochleicola gelatinilyticus]
MYEIHIIEKVFRISEDFFVYNLKGNPLLFCYYIHVLKVYVDFDKTPDGGNNTIHRMRIDEQGHVGIGTENSVITEKLVVEGKIKATSINFSELVVFASDAAAGAGGLTSGDIYKTNDGTLKIKM